MLLKIDQWHSSDVQRRNIGVKLKLLFKNHFSLEISQKVKEIGSYLEIMSFQSSQMHFKLTWQKMLIGSY